MLKQGQTVRMGHELYRVEHVSAMRAYIVPLAKRHVVLEDGSEFDSDRRGVSISPESPLEVVDDIERARIEVEFKEAQEQLAALKKALAAEERVQKKAVQHKVEREERETAPVPAKRLKGGWHVLHPTSFKAGSLAEEVMAFLMAHPNCDTKDVVVQATGNVASCISRFMQAGLIVRK